MQGHTSTGKIKWRNGGVHPCVKFTDFFLPKCEEDSLPWTSPLHDLSNGTRLIGVRHHRSGDNLQHKKTAPCNISPVLLSKWDLHVRRIVMHLSQYTLAISIHAPSQCNYIGWAFHTIGRPIHWDQLLVHRTTWTAIPAQQPQYRHSMGLESVFSSCDDNRAWGVVTYDTSGNQTHYIWKPNAPSKTVSVCTVVASHIAVPQRDLCFVNVEMLR